MQKGKCKAQNDENPDTECEIETMSSALEVDIN
jgi:hypothetical protein